MRAFAFLSLAAVAFAAPLVAPGGVANVVAPVNAVVDAAVNAATKVVANADVSALNVDAAYNSIGNNDLNNNNVDVLRRSVTVKNIGLNHSPVDVDASHAAVNAVSHTVHNRAALVDIVAALQAYVKALIDLCTSVGVDANAAIANIGINQNNILNGVGNANNVNVAKRATADIVADLVAAAFACIKSALAAGVGADVLIGNIQATRNSILNNVANGNNVNVASRSVVAAFAPITGVIYALVQAVTQVCVGLTVEILNIAITKNDIANNVLNSNTINLLS